jgi:hypothetical protein
MKAYNSRSRRFFSKRSSKFASVDDLLLLISEDDNFACERAVTIELGSF